MEKGYLEIYLGLIADGKDANQRAGIMAGIISGSVNLGIGIMIKNGKPIAAPASFYQPLSSINSGKYVALSDDDRNKLKEFFLEWQGVPKRLWDKFSFGLPTAGGGTSALNLALIAQRLISPFSLEVEEGTWAVHNGLADLYSDYEAIKTAFMPQLGAFNPTGERDRDIESLSNNYDVIIGDRAYPGFERSVDFYCGKLTVDELMKESYDEFIDPILKDSTSLVLSFTKAFSGFDPRFPGGVLVFSETKKGQIKMQATLKKAERLSGAGFLSSSSQLLVNLVTETPGILLNQFENNLSALGESEILWQKATAETDLEYLFSSNYAGLFRQFKFSGKEEDIKKLFDAGIVVVINNDTIRINIMGATAETIENIVKILSELIIVD